MISIKKEIKTKIPKKVKNIPKKDVENNKSTNLEHETIKTAYSIFKFARFTSEFSKWISLVFILCWVITLLLSFIAYFITGSAPTDVMEYVNQPTLIVCGFYFGTKMIENVSKAVCAYLYKKLNIKPVPDETSLFDSGDYNMNGSITDLTNTAIDTINLDNESEK